MQTGLTSDSDDRDFDPSAPARGVAIIRWNAGRPAATTDTLAVEEPLAIRVRGRPISVTMRTPGHDAELAVGFLLSEGVIARASDVLHARHCGSDDYGNTIDVLLAPETHVDFESLTRHVFASSSCGLCGKATIESLQSRLPAVETDMRIGVHAITALPEVMRAAQATFDSTGGLHAAALFDSNGTLRVLREDVGRHNAVDKVIGHALLGGWWPLDRHILLVSGRTSFEIVQKALAARIPIIASVSAPSSLAVQLAADGGQTLVGFLRGEKMNVYTHPDRICLEAAESLAKVSDVRG